MVKVDDFLHIAQAQAVALDIVDVAVGHPVEVIENLGNGFLRDSDTFVGDREDEILVVRQGVDQNFRTVGGVFDGVFDQVGDGIGQVGAVAEQLVVVRIQRDGQHSV